MTDFKAPYGPLAFFLDLEPEPADFRADVEEGLAAARKTLSPKYFYDARGAEIFEKITTLDAYYPTRTERAILDASRDAVRAAVGPNRAILEYGSGSSEKIRRLLDMVDRPSAYVAVDISRDQLIDGMSALAGDVAPLPIGAVCADFTAEIALPNDAVPAPAGWFGFFPGSTLGNFDPVQASAFLSRAAATLGDGATMLVGIDLYKDEAVLQRAYDDPDGVTAAFNLNVFRRMKNELDAAIDLDAFVHEARVEPQTRRVEMHLRARRATEIVIGERAFAFAEGETLHTENSYKYDDASLADVVAPTPWRIETIWKDPKGWFAACFLRNS
ncbi:MAG: L-histidine N(alpha)-methyltransferase [Pseudomonadota bacterium]